MRGVGAGYLPTQYMNGGAQAGGSTVNELNGVLCGYRVDALLWEHAQPRYPTEVNGREQGGKRWQGRNCGSNKVKSCGLWQVNSSCHEFPVETASVRFVIFP